VPQSQPYTGFLARPAHLLVIAALVAAVGAGVVAAAPSRLAIVTYYVDCKHGRDGASGRSPHAAWKTLARASRTTYKPGDRLLLRRGVACQGMLAPKGSGSPGEPIRIDAYGKGSLPRIFAGRKPAAIKLFDQGGWEIAHLKTYGGDPRGIYIGANHGTWRHFRISDVVVYGVGGSPTSKSSGLIDVEPNWGSSGHLEDVVISRATAYGTTQWAGIHIGCVGKDEPPGSADHAVIRNSTAHDVAGDGITIFSCNGALISHSVAYRTGEIRSARLGTPNAIWTWACSNCTVAHNVAYDSHSPAGDGGLYDIDFHSSNTTVEYNYGHVADGYCIAVFGAQGQATTNSVVRYNVCSNDAREKSLAHQGDVFLYTWQGGSLDGLKIYGNTFSWHPAASKPLLENSAKFSGSAKDLFENNLVYSTVPSLVDSDKGLALDHNLWWTTSARKPTWRYGGKTYKGFAAYRSGSGQDAAGIYANPRLSDPSYHAIARPTRAFRLEPGSPAIDAGAALGSMGSRDFFGDKIPRGKAYDIGADEAFPKAARRR
jgi:parallel beta helix pectate lyase-like protein